MSYLKLICLFALSSVFSLPIFASPSIAGTSDGIEERRLIKSLKSHHKKFNQLLDMRTKVDQWEARLLKTDKRLADELQISLSDLKQRDEKKISAAAFHRKWHHTGRWDRLQSETIKFRADVVRYNAFREEYNLLSLQLDSFLNARDSEALRKLMNSMRVLISNLESALARNDLTQAQSFALKSQLAQEFGYRNSPN